AVGDTFHYKHALWSGSVGELNLILFRLCGSTLLSLRRGREIPKPQPLWPARVPRRLPPISHFFRVEKEKRAKSILPWTLGRRAECLARDRERVVRHVKYNSQIEDSVLRPARA